MPEKTRGAKVAGMADSLENRLRLAYPPAAGASTGMAGRGAMDGYNVNPFNKLPAPVWALALSLAGIEAVLQAGAAGLVGGPQAIGWRLELVRLIGLPAQIVAWMWETGSFPPEHLARLAGFGMVQTGAVHALFVVIFVLALGNRVAQTLGGWAVWLLYVVSGAVGGVVWGLVWGDPGSPVQHWLLGGYPAAFGLVGAFTALIWMDAAGEGINRLRAFRLIGVLIVVRVAFGVIGGFGTDWVADIAGFAAGFALAVAMKPGLALRALDWLRQR